MRTVARFGVVGLAAAYAFACAPAASDGRVADASADTLVYTGTIVDGGTSAERMVILEQDGGQPVRLGGPLEGELARLAGGTVRASGVWTALYGGALEVGSYRLIGMDGGEPIVGVVRDRAGELWIEGESSVRLIGAPAALRPLVGARVWVVGRPGQEGLSLQSYGVIAPVGGS